MTSELLVVGVGNGDRGDDAAGPAVCRRLDRLGLDGVRTMVVETGGVEILSAWCSDDDVVLVDAAAPGGTPGSVTWLDGRAECRPVTGALSTHGVDVSAWIELADVIGALPRSLTVIAIEGADFDHGRPLSSAVERAVDDVVDEITRLATTPSADR